MLQVPLMPVGPRDLNRGHLTHVSLPCSDHGNSIVDALRVLRAECLLEMLREREPFKILRPEFLT